MPFDHCKQSIYPARVLPCTAFGIINTVLKISLWFNYLLDYILVSYAMCIETTLRTCLTVLS